MFYLFITYIPGTGNYQSYVYPMDLQLYRAIGKMNLLLF